MRAPFADKIGAGQELMQPLLVLGTTSLFANGGYDEDLTALGIFGVERGRWPQVDGAATT